MSTMPQTRAVATGDLRILAYAQHMAQTAQPTAAKLLFEFFAQQEKQRIEANGSFQLPSTPHGIGEDQTPPDSVSEQGPVRTTRAGSRIERTEAMRQKSDARKE